MILRQRFKLTPRRFNQRLIRWLLITGCLLLFGMNALFALTYLDQRRMRNEFLMQRSMLDARAEIQATLIRFHSQRREASDEEIRRMFELWEQAEYPERFKP